MEALTPILLPVGTVAVFMLGITVGWRLARGMSPMALPSFKKPAEMPKPKPPIQVNA